MVKLLTKRPISSAAEPLEVRRYLALAVAVDDGQLSVTGEASGPVEIVTTAEAVVGCSVKVRLGDGKNTFNHEGNIEGNLSVTSKNESDTATVAETAVVGGGEPEITLGEQEDGFRRFGRGRRFGFFDFGRGLGRGF